MDPGELDPCLAAEQRMKKKTVGDKMKLAVAVSVSLLFLLIVAGVCIFLFGSSKKMDELYDDPIIVEEEDFASTNNEVTRRPPPPPPPVTTRKVIHPPTTYTRVSYSWTEFTISTAAAPTTSPSTITTTTTTTTVPPPVTIHIPVEEPSTTAEPHRTSTSTTTSTTSPPPPVTRPPPTAAPAVRPRPTTTTTTSRAPTNDESSSGSAYNTSQDLQLHPTNVPLTAEIRQSCLQHRDAGLGSGIYRVNPDGGGAFYVFCDMSTDGGGWTVIQRRDNDDGGFYQSTFEQYERGFGNLYSSHWLGLSHMHRLAPEGQRPQTLRIELRGDTCTSKGCSGLMADGFWWGEWDFTLADRDSGYRLAVGEEQKRGNMTNPTALKRQRWETQSNGMRFSAWDRDVDLSDTLHCAQFRHYGGWWHRDCTLLALNGKYGDHRQAHRQLVYFRDGRQDSYQIKPLQTVMMLRPEL